MISPWWQVETDIYGDSRRLRSTDAIALSVAMVMTHHT
jgi:hypothetical protein